MRYTLSITANEADIRKTKHCEKYHYEGSIVSFSQDSAGVLADGAFKFVNFLFQGSREGGSVSKRK